MSALRPAVISGASDLIVPGEFALRAGDFRRIASMIYDDAEIFLSESKATLVYARLAKRLRTLRLEFSENTVSWSQAPKAATSATRCLRRSRPTSPVSSAKAIISNI